MVRGRRPEGEKLFDGFDVPEETKARAMAIVQTLSGKKRLSVASKELGISKTQFQSIRHEALSGLLSALLPRERGRPRKVEDPKDQRIAGLEKKIESLTIDLEAEKCRADLAMVMPRLLVSRSKKKRGRRRG